MSALTEIIIRTCQVVRDTILSNNAYQVAVVITMGVLLGAGDMVTILYLNEKQEYCHLYIFPPSV
jgi:hypothetical protein